MSMVINQEAASAGQFGWRLLFRRAFLALAPLLLTGCYTVNMAQCTIPDNESNRVAATSIVASVAIKHRFEAHEVDKMVMLGSYSLAGNSPKRPLSLDLYADAGTITASLSQTIKKKKPATETFLRTERDLVKGFKEKFGTAVEINFSNEDAP